MYNKKFPTTPPLKYQYSKIRDNKTIPKIIEMILKKNKEILIPNVFLKPKKAKKTAIK